VSLAASACCTSGGSSNPFTDDDVELLEVVVDRVAGATQRRMLAVEQGRIAAARTQPAAGFLAEVRGSISRRFAAADERCRRRLVRRVRAAVGRCGSSSATLAGTACTPRS
jgi:GAF domain-containing protein